MAEIITEEKNLGGQKKRKISIIIIVIIVIVLAVVGYLVSQCDTCNQSNNAGDSQLMVGDLDYKKPFGFFTLMPIESGIDLEKATLVKYEEGQEITTVSYTSSKTKPEILSDFEGFFTQNSWQIANKDEFSIYGQNGSDSVSVLTDEKDGQVSVVISYTKEVKDK